MSERVTRLRLDPRCLARLLRAALEAAPEEACGLIEGRRAGAELVVLDVPAARNVAARSLREFELAPGDVLALHDAAALRGLDIVGAWHSHPQGEPEPSRADLARAWPGHVVVIVARGTARAFAVEEGRARELCVGP